MGWNSWNHFGDRVDEQIVRETADAMVSSGMAAAGYVFINIDDCWEGHRDAQGNIVPNTKFPDMKALADYVHQRGLKLGIYSSPGPRTCGGYEGSYGHEEQDAKTYAAWGIDYLKYDWCSAARVYADSSAPGGLPEDGPRPGAVRPAHRLQPVRIWHGRRLEMGPAGRRQSLAHHRRHPGQLEVDVRDRLQPGPPRALCRPRPLERSRTCSRSATAA